MLGPNSRETRLWHGQVRMADVKSSEVVIVRGQGAYVWDERGHRMLDVPAGLWYCNIGHGRREMASAISAQVEQLEAYSTFQQYANRPALDLAERLVASAPLGPGAKVFFGNGGSDAVEIACKLARRYWAALGSPSKRTIIARDRSYHGLHGFGTSIGGLDANREGYGELIPDVIRVETNSWAALEDAVRSVGADAIATFICEPIIGAGGIIHPPEGYLENVERICRDNDILFIVDEVITGFGRTGEMFACDRYGLQPDFMLFAKAVTSGYIPLGGAIIAERVAEPFWADGSTHVFRHGLTYAGHPTACAAALMNLDIISREGLVDRARELESVLASALEPLGDHPRVLEVRTGVGLLGGVQLVDAHDAPYVCEWCCDHGILARLVGDGDTIQISPPLIITEAEIHEIAQVIADAVEQVDVQHHASAPATTS